MFEVCNNNLEMVVIMFLDGGGIVEEFSISLVSVFIVRLYIEEEVCVLIF